MKYDNITTNFFPSHFRKFTTFLLNHIHKHKHIWKAFEWCEFRLICMLFVLIQCHIHLFFRLSISMYLCWCDYFQGTPGEKGQKGDLGQPAIDVFQAVKVQSFAYSLIFLMLLCFNYNVNRINFHKDVYQGDTRFIALLLRIHSWLRDDIFSSWFNKIFGVWPLFTSTTQHSCAFIAWTVPTRLFIWSSIHKTNEKKKTPRKTQIENINKSRTLKSGWEFFLFYFLQAQRTIFLRSNSK